MLPLILILLAQTRLSPDQIKAHTPPKPGTRPNFSQAVKLAERGMYRPDTWVQRTTLITVATGERRPFAVIVHLENPGPRR